MRILCAAFCTVFYTFYIHAQTDTTNHRKITEIEQVAITGYRNQSVFSPSSREVTVIKGSEIRKSGIQNLQDLIEFVSNADIRQRGELGVQADVSIRGGTFDHVMVLINGINMSDPQTGHASLDIPVDPEIIDRIEVLSGSAARILGAGAFTGAINVVTKSGNSNQASMGLSFGDFAFGRTNVNISFNHSAFRHVLSVGASRSDGYMDDTDFRIRSGFYRLNYDKESTHIDFQAGVQDKHFGAADFYSPRFTNQYEETGLWFASIRASSGRTIKISPSVYWRHRKDHYILDRDNPPFYENYHRTDIIGSQLNITWKIKKILNTVGFDVRSENILSNNIGFDRPDPVPVKGTDSAFYTRQYGRSNLAYFQEHEFSFGKFRISGGISISWNNAYPDKPSVFPGLDINYDLVKSMRLFFSFNRALHLPTFTDLFYTDPLNQGNLHLVPNKMVSYEGGARINRDNIHASVCLFSNKGKDIIDWLWSYSSNRYSPVNLQKYRAMGIETHVEIIFPASGSANPIRNISLNYVLMNLDKSVNDSVSKYDYLRNKLSLRIRHQVIGKLEAVWSASFQDRAGMMIDFNPEENAYFSRAYNPYWLIDATLIWHTRFMDIYATLNNLLDTDYTDAGSVNQPGRWFKAGITLKLGNGEE